MERIKRQNKIKFAKFFTVIMRSQLYQATQSDFKVSGK